MRSRAALAALALAFLALACFVLRPHPTGGPALRDFESYVGGGGAWSAGLDPYGTAVWNFERRIPDVVATRDELLPFVGPPFGLLLWAPFAALSYPVACAIWSTLLALALATVVFGSLRLAHRPLDAFDYLGAALLCAGFGPSISGIALGQVAVFASGAIVATLLALDRYPEREHHREHDQGRHSFARSAIIRSLVATICATLAALQPNLALVLVARLRERAAIAALVGAAFAAYALSALTLRDLAWPARYLGLLHAHGDAERGLAIQTTVAGIALDYGASPTLANMFASVIAACVVIALALQFASRRYDDVARVALACAAIPLLAPFAHEHDFTIVLIAALVTLARASRTQRPFVIAAILLAGVDWLGLAQRPTGAAQTAALTLAATCALAMIGARRVAFADLAPGALAVAVVAIANFGSAHPLPMWPDGLATNWHATPPLGDPRATAAGTWHQEQLAAGLAGTGPFSASLRALSLFGCLALWSCATRVLARERATITSDARSRAPEPLRPSDARAR